MFDIEVFAASILRDLKLHKWSDFDRIAKLIDGIGATVTRDSHLVLRYPQISRLERDSVIDVVTAACSKTLPELLLSGGFALKVPYRNELLQGNLRHLEPSSCANYQHPNVVGDVLNQQSGFTTISVASEKRVLRPILDKWTDRSLSSNSGCGPFSIYLAESGNAIQARLNCTEVSLEDVIDILIAALFAIKDRKDSKLILGLSYTEVVASPHFFQKCVMVEDALGPFQRISDNT